MTDRGPAGEGSALPSEGQTSSVVRTSVRQVANPQSAWPIARPGVSCASNPEVCRMWLRLDGPAGVRKERYQTAPRYPAAAAVSVARVLCWPLSEAVFGTEPIAFGRSGGGMGKVRSWGVRDRSAFLCLQPIGGFSRVHKPYPPERQFSLQSLKHAPDSLSCPVREKKHKLGTMTTTSKHLYPFIQHSVNVYCEPDITSGCVPAVPDVTVIHTRMFLEWAAFLPWLYQGFLSFVEGTAWTE